jgi:hypothetical protein
MRYNGRWTIAQPTVGERGELLLTSLDSGWAFGAFPSEPEESLAFWRLAPHSLGVWIEDPALRLPGRRLIDTYQRAPGGQDRIFVSLEPTGGLDPVVYAYRSEDEAWEPIARPPPPVAEAVDGQSARGGSGAVAPLTLDTLLYAWGDDVWSINLPDDVWSPVRGRSRLGPLAAGWASALSVDGTGARFVASTPGWTRPWLSEAAPLAEWAFLGGSATAAWALAREGTALTVRGPLGRWRIWNPPDRPRDVTAIHAEGDAVLAAGRQDGTLAVWRGDAESWRRLPFHGDADPVTATLASMEANGLAAWPDGRIWVVAGVADPDGTSTALGAAIALPPSCRNADCAAIAYTFGVPLTTVAAASADEAWAAGRHVLIRCDAHGCAQQSPSPAPFGAHFVALAAGAWDDVWAVLQEGDPTRPTPLVIHFDGVRWQPACRADIALTGASVVQGAGRRALWLTGDWTTVIRHEYRSSADAERPCGAL